MLGVVIEDDLFPGGRNKQPRLSATIGNHIGFSIAGKVGGNGGIGMKSGVDDVFFPTRFVTGMSDHCAGERRRCERSKQDECTPR
jgi:hypothetical protein